MNFLLGQLSSFVLLFLYFTIKIFQSQDIWLLLDNRLKRHLHKTCASPVSEILEPSSRAIPLIKYKKYNIIKAEKIKGETR